MLVLLLLANKRISEEGFVASEYGNYCSDKQRKVIDDILSCIGDPGTYEVTFNGFDEHLSNAMA